MLVVYGNFAGVRRRAKYLCERACCGSDRTSNTRIGDFRSRVNAKRAGERVAGVDILRMIEN
jgi:hypothetical protein